MQSPKAPKQYPKPPEGTWTEHYSELGTAPVSYESSISPEFYEQVVQPMFERGGVFYVLPDKASLAETFPEFVKSRKTAKR